jgi:hypothetical protein
MSGCATDKNRVAVRSAKMQTPRILSNATSTVVLSIALSDQNVILTWPLLVTDFVLQVWDGDLSTPATGMGVEVKPDVTNDQNMVTLPIGDGTKFYRLSNP